MIIPSMHISHGTNLNSEYPIQIRIFRVKFRKEFDLKIRPFARKWEGDKTFTTTIRKKEGKTAHDNQHGLNQLFKCINCLSHVTLQKKLVTGNDFC